VDPKGGRYWRVAYRFAGKQKTLALEAYPNVWLADARTARDAAKRRLAAGIDPSQARKEEKRAATDRAGDIIDRIIRKVLREYMPALLTSASIDPNLLIATSECTVQRNLSPSRCCGECRRTGFSERRFEDGDVLLNGATAYADARDPLALAGERRSAAH
jgi:hypothetical protein